MLYQAIIYAWDEVGNGRSHSHIDGPEERGGPTLNPSMEKSLDEFPG